MTGFPRTLPLARTMLLSVAALSLAVLSLTAQAIRQDGPYVLWTGKEARILEVREGNQLGERRAKAPFSLELPGLAAGPLRLNGKPYAAAGESWPEPARILAVSDIHGNFDGLLALLKAQKVVDEKLRWIFGKGHLVIAGDVFDRGPQVTEALWFLRTLEEGARKAGGAVHMLLGNHETMVMAGDLRYLHPKYAQALPGLPPQTELYGPDAELGRWLCSRPVFLKLGRFLFVHGGPSPAFLAQDLNQASANQGIRQAIGKRAKETEGQTAFLLGSEGPLWYRGLVPGQKGAASSEELDQLLKAFGVKAIVLGHTTQEALTSYFEGRVFAIDAGLKDGKPGEAWIWEKGQVWRGTADGQRVLLTP